LQEVNIDVSVRYKGNGEVVMPDAHHIIGTDEVVRPVFMDDEYLSSIVWLA
jgi:hypothetical protein